MRLQELIMRDFATKRTRISESAPKSKPKVKKPKTGAPGALWMFGGLLLGVLIAFGIVQHKSEITQWFAKHQKAKTTVVAKKTIQKAKPVKKIAQKPQFDFYNILPNQGSGVSVKSVPTVVSASKLFMVQVASYPKKSSAQTMRAKLLMLGFSPKIDLTGSGWYRVDIGPVTSVRKGDLMRHQLQKAGIAGAMIRQVSVKAKPNAQG